MTTTPKLSAEVRKGIMGRAWAIFRKTYSYQGRGKGIGFNRIGRDCFGWALQEAWRLARNEAKAAARLAAIAPAERAERLSSLQASLANVHFIDSTRRMVAETAALKAEIAHLTAFAIFDMALAA